MVQSDRRRKSQSLINQGNILTYSYNRFLGSIMVSVAIPYKSGKYSYVFAMFNDFKKATGMSQSLINQGNILTRKTKKNQKKENVGRNPL